MKRILLSVLLPLSLAGAAAAQTTYNGNGNTGFGGVVGPGTLTLTQSGNTVNATLTKGSGAFNDALAIYLDTRAGGVANTANLTDAGDLGRRAVSGFDGGNRSVVNFPGGFTADYAIVVQNGFVGIFEIVEGGSHIFVTSGNLAVSGNDFTFDFDFAEVGATGTSFDFVASYLNPSNAFRSDEAIGGGVPAGNPGNNPITFSAALNFGAAPLPVALTSLSAKPLPGAVRLSWQTATERANAGFGVERSRDGVRWTEIGFVAGFGESRQLRDYGYTDKSPLAGTSYYRLVQRDFDGLGVESATVAVERVSEVLERDFEYLGANPIGDRLVRILNPGAEASVLRLISSTGQQVARLHVDAGQTATLELGPLPAGVYFLQGQRQSLRLILH